MGISNFHNAEQFHQSLHNLAEGSQSDFKKSLENLSSGGEDATEKVADLIIAKKELLSKSDVGALLKVGKNLVASGASQEGPSLKKISALCMDLIGKAPSLDSMPEIKALFFDRPAVEKAYVADLLSTLSVDVRQGIVQILTETPTDQKIPLLESLIAVFKNTTDGDHRAKILSTISTIPLEQRENVIKLALPLLQDIKNGILRAKILSTISMIPQDQRENVIKLALPLFRDLTYIFRAKILETIFGIPQEQRENVITSALPLLQDITRDFEIAKILETISGIPLEQRESIFELALPLLQDITDGRGAILKAVFKTPQGERQEVIKLALPLLTDITYSSHRAEIFETIAEIPREQRENVITSAMPLLQDIKIAIERAAILKVVSKIPQNERAEFIKLALPLLQDIKNGIRRAEILKTIFEMPQNERAEFIKLALPLFKDITDGTQIAKILTEIAGMSADKRQLLFSAEKSPDFIVKLMQIEGLSDKLQRIIIWQTFQNNPTLVEAIHTHLLSQLISSTNREETLELAEFIMDHWDELLIHEDHPLAQEAINKQILTADSDDQKNPYSIYKKLQIAAQEKIAIDPPPTVVAGKAVAFVPATFQSRTTQNKITFDRIPSGISPLILKTLFESLETRLNTLEDPQQRTKAYAYIQEIVGGDSFENLRANFVNDTHLKMLLSLKGSPSDEAPLNHAQFLAIMKYVSDQSTVVKAAELLSPQEEILLKLSASIQHCTGGKNEGIAIAYNLLPPEYRYAHEKANTPKVEQGKAYLDEIIQNSMSDLFTSDGPLMKELTGEPEFVEKMVLNPTTNLEEPKTVKNETKQLAHQSIYLKNLIGPKVGFQHRLVLDQYTGTLYDELIGKSQEDVLTIFYKHYTPDHLVQLLQTRFDADKGARTDLYDKLNAILESQKTLTSEDYKTVWGYDEDDDEPVFALTEEGARRILVAADFLKEVQ